MAEKSQNRVAYSPLEFAELFGKSQTWGYRQIYAGKVVTITQHGRILIPAKEVERILGNAGIYNGPDEKKPPKAKKAAMTPQQVSIWERYVKMRRVPASSPSSGEEPKSSAAVSKKKKRPVSTRIGASWSGKPKKTQGAEG